MLVMTLFSLPPEGLPLLRAVMTTFLHVLSLPSRRLKKASCYRARISSEVFFTILPLHWTQVEYCFIFCAVVSLVSTIFYFTLRFPGDFACHIQKRSNHALWVIHLFAV